MLLPVEEGNFAAESGKKAALHFRILRKMMRGKGEGEVWMSGQLCEPLDGVWCSENLTAMIFYCNGDAVLGGGISMWLHALNEFSDLGPEICSGCCPVAGGATNDDLASEALGDRKFGGEAEGSKFVLGESSELDLMFREEFLEFRQTHHGDLFTMVGMRSRPDIDEGCPGFVDLG